MSEQAPEDDGIDDVENGLPGDDEDGTEMPDDYDLVPSDTGDEEQTPVPDGDLDFPDSGDDSHGDDDVEDPDVLDDDSQAVG